MSYMHIPNLYKDDRILAFKKVYAMEKVHGTSAHVAWRGGKVEFFPGGIKPDTFRKLFDEEQLAEGFKALEQDEVIVYGEAYGGKCQGMKEVYGPDLKFVAFEVQIGAWLAVPQAEQIVVGLGLEFVDYVLVPSDLATLDGARDVPSMQARLNGMGEHPREGIVLRPHPFEVTLNNGGRLIAKHKTEAYQERRKQPKPGQDPEVLKAAQAIAEEWVTEMRLVHVLDAFPDANIEQTGDIIKAMVADVEREAEGEIVTSSAARGAICRCTAQMFKARLQAQLEEKHTQVEEKEKGE